MFSFFTTNEANMALPDVIKKFEYALAKKNEISKLEQKLQMSMSSTNSFEEYVTLKQKLNSAEDQMKVRDIIYKHIPEIRERIFSG